MPLQLYNSLSRRKEPFEPLDPGQVKMYCCGVTVYDYCHLGHARSYVVWDTLRRYLLWRGYQVRYVQNFTDIDDKILKRAQQEAASMEAISDRFTQAYFEDMARLNVLTADAYPRATHTLDGIKRLIDELAQKGYAYQSHGDVYYSVGNFSEYGRLSGRQPEDMQAGASGRIEAADSEAAQKKDPFDFALWKAAKPGEPAWDSPWGKGRPGWHIECSAMVRSCLGETIDIHMGGEDLKFPHHENEIAQSEAVTGQPLARYWLHNGFVNVNNQKMAKSLGNFTTIRNLLDSATGLEPMALRLFVLQAHYRKPIDFTDQAVTSARNSWATLAEGLRFGYQYGQKLAWPDWNDPGFGDPNRMRIPDSDSVKHFQAAMDDDINTPGALSVLFELAKELRRQGNLLVHQGQTELDPQLLERRWYTLVALAQVLGIEAQISTPGINSQADSPEDADSEISNGISDREVETLVQQRSEARKAKDFAQSDLIRDQLKAQGITLIDQPGGETRWHRD